MVECARSRRLIVEGLESMWYRSWVLAVLGILSEALLMSRCGP